MRKIEEIKADYNDCKNCKYDHSCLYPIPIDFCNKKYNIEHYQHEYLKAITDSIPLDRLQEICNAERDGRCVDVQELYNRLKVAEFDRLFLEIEDYAEGYNKAIRDLTYFLLWEYGVKPLSKEQAEQALKGGVE